MLQPKITKDSTKIWANAHLINQVPSKTWLLLPIICLTIVCASVIFLSNVEFNISIDWAGQKELFHFLNKGLSILPESIWANLTQLGDAVVLVPLLALVLVSRSNVWITIFYAAPISGITCFAMKRFFDTPRPSAILESGSYNQIGELLGGRNSFPSGHTTTVFVAIIAVLCANFPSPNNYAQKAAIGLGILFAGIVGLSRVAVGAHWPLDVIFGAGIGAASAIYGAQLTKKYDNSWIEKSFIQLCGMCIPAILSMLLLYRILVEDESTLVVLVAAVCGLLASASTFVSRSYRDRALSSYKTKRSLM